MDRRTNNRRGQAATEFIMTYGWAILAVLVAIGALAYFGIMNPGRYLPERCLFPSEFNCKDHKMNGSGALTVQFRLENKVGQAITVEALNISVAGTQKSNAACIPASISMGSDTYHDFSCDIANAGDKTGKNMKILVTLKYKKLQGSYSHIANGEIQSTIQE